jgi:hypothetical protein
MKNEYETTVYKLGHIVSMNKFESIKKAFPSYPLVEEPDGWFRMIRQEDIDEVLK